MLETYNHRFVSPFTLSHDDIDIETIAHSLSLKCRFAGHCDTFYSVAQHSVECVRFVEKWYREYSHDELKWLLLHDAAEVWLGDIVSPEKKNYYFKVLEAIYPFDKIESDILYKVAVKFLLPWPIPSLIKKVDSHLLAIEKKRLGFKLDWDTLPHRAGSGVNCTFFKIRPVCWEQAKERFMETYERLFNA